MIEHNLLLQYWLQPFLSICGRECLIVGDGLAQLEDAGIIQPAVFELGGQAFVKLDRKALEVADPSCFADVIDFLLRCYYVFGVDFPPPQTGLWPS